MESDEFYDSLEEEELEYENNQCPSYTAKVLYTDSLEDDSDDVIPFYDGNLSLSQIELSGHSSKYSGFLVAKSSKPKVKVSSTRPRKTYLKLFYERNCDRRPESRNPNNAEDGNKVVCYTPSPKSFTTCEDTNINSDDGDSVYLRSNHSESEISSTFDKPTMRIPELQLESNNESKYYSISDNNMDSYKSAPSHSNVNSRSTSYTKNSEFDKIGAVITNPKFESWKRRQQYGRKVSETNRIKMNEKKILRNLERELQNSKLCVK